MSESLPRFRMRRSVSSFSMLPTWAESGSGFDRRRVLPFSVSECGGIVASGSE